MFFLLHQLVLNYSHSLDLDWFAFLITSISIDLLLFFLRIKLLRFNCPSEKVIVFQVEFLV